MNTSKLAFPGDKVISPEQIDELRTIGLHNKCRFPGYHRVNSDLVRAGELKGGMMIAVSRTGKVEYYKKDTLMSR